MRTIVSSLCGWVRWALLFIAIAAGWTPVRALGPLAQNQTEAQVERSEFRKLLPLTSFYTTPTPLPAGPPGELIRSQEFDEYQLPEGVSAYRILYHSRSASGADVAASGVVLTPDQPSPAGGWPVIAWAHGFTGTGRYCAPSLMRNLNQGPFLSMYVKLGYAVVATDYAGLGTEFRSASIDMRSNAADVIYSIAAARSALPQLGRRWLAMGESAGGLSALAVAELEGDLRDPGYLGSIAVSGIADAKDFYEQLAKGNSPGQLIFLAYGVETLYPRFQANQILTKKALALYRQIGNACAMASPESVAPNQILTSDWEENSFLQEFFARNTIGMKRAYGPLLIISSDAEAAARPGSIARSVARLCKQGDLVQFHAYPASEFASVLGDSVREQLAWIQARFAGRSGSSNCH